MFKSFPAFIVALFCCYSVVAQDMAAFADSIRIAYKIPELSYAVVSGDSVLEMYALGVNKINTQRTASLNDRFRIGSNTKAITGFIASRLVKQGKLSWNTKFFDLFPELKAGSRKEYYNLTLLQLLSLRTRLYSYTYTYAEPVKGQFTGNDSMQRYQFAKWFFKHAPAVPKDSICFSNLGYVAAGLMLEKVTEHSFSQLVADLGTQLGIDFDFGQPNTKDTLQTWGHDANLVPEPPTDGYKLNWLQAAGNINATLPGYAKFIQLQLRGLARKSDMLTKEEFNFLHYGLRKFSVGWFWDVDENGHQYSHNTGNPGTFLSQVYVFGSKGRAFILLSNCQTDAAGDGMDIVLAALEKKYSCN